MRYSASALVPMGAETVHAVLTDAGHLATWNPAFSSIDASGPAERGKEYRAIVRGIAPVTLTFNHLDPGDIGYILRGLGSTEKGRWTSVPAPGGTHVTHSFEHSGLVLMLMHNAFVHVAEWRLGRLRDQALKANPEKKTQP